MLSIRLSLLLAPLALAACAAQPPFIQPETNTNVEKQTDRILRDGRTAVCFADSTPWEAVVKEADYACGNYGYRAHYLYQEHWQCSVGTPHLALFACYHPDMRYPSGAYILAHETRAITAWQARTHKQLPKRRAFARPGADPVEDVLPYLPGTPGAGAGATPPAPPTPAATTPGAHATFGASPGQLMQWPMGEEPGGEEPGAVTDNSAASTPVTAPAATTTTAPTASPQAPIRDFNLPAGSWGEVFEQ